MRIRVASRWPYRPFRAALISLPSSASVKLTGRQDSVLALVGVQLLVIGLCYVHYRKALAAKPEPSS
jgi:hypothetical protein